jgi:hypothetical protein
LPFFKYGLNFERDFTKSASMRVKDANGVFSLEIEIVK